MNIIQTSTKMKEVLKEADYKKMLPIIEYISENDSITIKKAKGKTDNSQYIVIK